MFENCSAHRQSPQVSQAPSSRRSPAAVTHGSCNSSMDSPSPGGQQRLKNAINLGKAKMTDLLRRKESSHMDDIGVTEVNKSVDLSWSLGPAPSSMCPLDSFPRLDPPPPSGKKRLPRALKTTQDMMISSVPVVSSPESSESASGPPTPHKSPPTPEKSPPTPHKSLPTPEETTPTPENTPIISPDIPEEEEAEPTDHKQRSGGLVDMDWTHTDPDEASRMVEVALELSIPDLINKDPREAWPKGGGADPTPGPGQDGAPCRRGSEEDVEAHSSPDLLSFE